MEPLARTSIVVTGNHLAEADLVAVAVPRLSLLVLVVALMEGLFVRGDRRRPSGAFLGIATWRWVCTPRWSRAGLGVFGKGRKYGSRVLRVPSFGCLCLERVGCASAHFLALVASCRRSSYPGLVVIARVGAGFVFKGTLAGCGSKVGGFG